MKNELRKKFRILRKELTDKKRKDEAINVNFLNSNIYKCSKQIYCYSALKGEIETALIIKSAFNDNKKVALPVCTDLNGSMDFYYIKSFDDVKIGAFGIMEPDLSKCEIALDFGGAVCVVPALSFDKNGYRLGYGKGYYDRFLEKYTSISVGLCYNSFLSDDLPINEHDKNVDYIFTENNIVQIERRF